MSYFPADFRKINWFKFFNGFDYPWTDLHITRLDAEQLALTRAAKRGHREY